ncbi:hypothetical protein SAMD00019534_054570 [Acytostelium subglobosum LB1]|uniref:hypothetical protein n=1 Tax=Acytostelium subglobosum LB1 TaxID=1410327 RepID=UPI000644C052|nr:hypothetical protein SAMD00019534_054570 [Acytostelium subglobosum LB1]GAM22282.1 hypothetical protein SAMD00019534_054570 [Acytostelium subglobosum LB1]|eukprot:XP_012754402.1 hypothetical protein SAMD00019534_054570 [Acytostelium subglobosum LB1]
MAQQSLKVKKTGTSIVKKSMVGLNKKVTNKSALELAKRKITRSMEVGISQKIEREMSNRVAKNNGKLSVLKADVPGQGKKKKQPQQKMKRNH